MWNSTPNTVQDCFLLKANATFLSSLLSFYLHALKCCKENKNPYLLIYSLLHCSNRPSPCVLSNIYQYEDRDPETVTSRKKQEPYTTSFSCQVCLMQHLGKYLHSEGNHFLWKLESALQLPTMYLLNRNSVFIFHQLKIHCTQYSSLKYSQCLRQLTFWIKSQPWYNQNKCFYFTILISRGYVLISCIMVIFHFKCFVSF